LFILGTLVYKYSLKIDIGEKYILKGFLIGLSIASMLIIIFRF
jgi:hypothetical protein|tara:strand:+ start:413 stop:541 length:129 start_codon:yes stop_codon:yes gene_type:complete